MKVRFLVQNGEDPDAIWSRHVMAYVRADMCPRCQSALDEYGRCPKSHGRWTVGDDFWQWDE